MAKYFQRGKFANLHFSATSFWKKNSILLNDFVCDQNAGACADNSFTKVLIMRGIGYRVFAIKNNFAKKKLFSKSFLYSLRPLTTKPSSWHFSEDVSIDSSSNINAEKVEVFSDEFLDVVNKKIYDEINFILNYDFPYAGYLLVRAGHTKDKFLPLTSLKNVLGLKKDRKLVIASKTKALSSNVAKQLWLHRPPSVYTGRGVRAKHIKITRKAGKKSKQKGKTF